MTAAALLLALAVAVLVPGAPSCALTRLEAPPSSLPHRVAGVSWGALGLTITALVVLTGHPGFVVSGAVLVGLTVWFTVRGRRRREADRASADVAAAATTLSLLLKAGMIPSAALAEAGKDSAPLRRAAAVARLGGDAAGVLEEEAYSPGQSNLALVAAAWRVGERTGAPVAAVLERVAEQLREQRRVQGVVESELSSARVSGRMMACLPLVGIGLGAAVGADPWSFFTTQVLGEVVLTAAVVLCAAGMVVTERIASGGVA